MTVDEITIRQEELALRRKEVHGARWPLLIALVTALIGIYTVYSTGKASDEAQARSTAQFTQTNHDEYYWNVVQGLESSSAAVQINSMRLLNLFVQDVSNFDNVDTQRLGAAQALGTLAAFVRDESGETSNGLRSFSSDIPMIVEPAMREIKDLAENWRVGSHDFDINEADLHGVHMPDFAPLGQMAAPAADFRRAELENMNLIKADFKAAFFTCANLQNSDFGGANLTNADLSGADLRSADLSLVSGLEIQQLSGVRVNEDTKLPDGLIQEISARTTVPWLDEDNKCTDMVLKMTGMLAGQGYSEGISCPQTIDMWTTDTDLQRRLKSNHIAAIAENVAAANATTDKGDPAAAEQLIAGAATAADVIAVCSARAAG